MSLLHTLRNSPWLARLALLWFASTLGVAVASPWVSGDHQVMVCSAGGLVKLAMGDDGGSGTTPAALDCPLCAVGGAPAPVAANASEPLQALSRVLHRIAPARIADLSAARPPARGPPFA